MYERSAIVLERYFNGVLEFDKKVNLKTIYKDYKEIIEELQNYQSIIEKEEKVINEFDEVANEIREIQKEQKSIYKSDIQFEENRNQLFESLDEKPETIEKQIIKVEENIDKNNRRLQELREDFINALTQFSDKQRERNKYSRDRRTEEKSHIQILEKCNNDIKEINGSIIKSIKLFQNSEDDKYKQEIIEIMINNGKDERIPFDKNAIESAVNIRNEIAKKEAECYITVYDKMRRILVEINNDEIKLDKHKKTLRDVSAKLAFLKAQKMYIVSFLDNERMAAINGIKTYKQLMTENCKNLELDMEQLNNMYDLILKEISGKATKKAYKELYNREYLKNIEEKAKNFEEEINSIKIKTGAIINSNYWRIDEIKNVYKVFQSEVNEKFGRDLLELKLEEIRQNNEMEDDIFKTKIDDENIEYVDEYEENEEYDNDEDEDEKYCDDDEEYDDEDEEYDDEDEDEEYDDENEEYDDEDEEYDNDEDEEYDDGDEEYDDEDEEYDDEDEEYDDEDEEYCDDDEYKNIDNKKASNNSARNIKRSPQSHSKDQNKKGKGIFKFF